MGLYDAVSMVWVCMRCVWDEVCMVWVYMMLCLWYSVCVLCVYGMGLYGAVSMVFCL